MLKSVSHSGRRRSRGYILGYKERRPASVAVRLEGIGLNMQTNRVRSLLRRAVGAWLLTSSLVGSAAAQFGTWSTSPERARPLPDLSGLVPGGGSGSMNGFPATVLDGSRYSINLLYERYDFQQCRATLVYDYSEDFELNFNVPYEEAPAVDRYRFDGQSERGQFRQLNPVTLEPFIAWEVAEGRDEIHRGLDAVELSITGRFVDDNSFAPPVLLFDPVSPTEFVFPTLYVGLVQSLEMPRAELIRAVTLRVYYADGSVTTADLNSRPAVVNAFGQQLVCDPFYQVIDIGPEESPRLPYLARTGSAFRIRLLPEDITNPSSPAAAPVRLNLTILYERASYGDRDADRVPSATDLTSFVGDMQADSDRSIPALGIADALNDDNADGRVSVRDFGRFQHSARVSEIEMPGVVDNEFSIIPSASDLSQLDSMSLVEIGAAERSGESMVFQFDDPNDMIPELEYDTESQAMQDFRDLVQDQIFGVLVQILDEVPAPPSWRAALDWSFLETSRIDVRYFPEFENYAIVFQRFGGQTGVPGVLDPLAGGSPPVDGLYFLPYANELNGQRQGVFAWARGHAVDGRFWDDTLAPDLLQNNNALRTWGSFLGAGDTAVSAVNGLYSAFDPDVHADLVEQQGLAFGPFNDSGVDTCAIAMAQYAEKIGDLVSWSFGDAAWVFDAAVNPLVYVPLCSLVIYNPQVFDQADRMQVGGAVNLLSIRMRSQGGP
ncbi:MAG: hypothetical protein AAFR38_07375 [Planctomycetota bacterium]